MLCCVTSPCHIFNLFKCLFMQKLNSCPVVAFTPMLALTKILCVEESHADTSYTHDILTLLRKIHKTAVPFSFWADAAELITNGGFEFFSTYSGVTPSLGHMTNCLQHFRLRFLALLLTRANNVIPAPAKAAM